MELRQKLKAFLTDPAFGASRDYAVIGAGFAAVAIVRDALGYHRYFVGLAIVATTFFIWSVTLYFRHSRK